MPNSNEILREIPQVQTTKETETKDQTLAENSQDDKGDWAITPCGQVIHPSKMTDRDWENLEFDHEYQRHDFFADYRG